jgi:hypothetical protein
MPDHSVAFAEAHRRFGQIQFWTHLEEVKPGMAPLQLVPREFGKDMSKAVELVCPAGTICIFTNYTCKTRSPLSQLQTSRRVSSYMCTRRADHSANDFTATEGQRYTWGVAFGRADSVFEGFRHYTHAAGNPHFRELVSALSPQERTLFRFPPVGDPAYTLEMLEALEERYLGFDSTGEYAKAMASPDAVAEAARL